MYAERVTIESFTTDASGDATAYSPSPVTGRILQARYVPDGTAPLSTDADVAVTGEESGVEVFTKANLGTSALTARLDALVLAAERLKLVVAQGGDTKAGGTWYFWIG